MTVPPQNLDLNFFTFLRILFALPLFLLVVDITKLSKKLILSFVLLGSIHYGVSYIVWVKSYFYADADINYLILFMSTTPIYVALISMINQGKLSYVNLFTSVISFLSILFIYNDRLSLNTKIFQSFAFAQLGNFCFAYGQVTYKRLQEKLLEVKDSDVFALMLFGALVIVIIATTASNGWNFLARVSYKEFGVIFYLGTVLSGICMFLWNKGACMVNDGTLAVMINLRFSLDALVSIIIFQEKNDLIRAIMSLVILCICIFIQEMYQRSDTAINQRLSVKI